MGRSPRVPFVQNLRTALKRNSSQRIIMRRNLSPGDQATNYGGDISEYSPQRYSLGKSDSNKKRRQQGRDGNSSADKYSHS